MPTHTMEQYEIININNSEVSTASSYVPNWNNLTSTIVPSMSGNNTGTPDVISFVSFFTLATAGPAIWKPAVTECTHITSTYVVPNVLHFMAFLIGFYMFRIQENEGLHALIEKVNGLLCFVYVSGILYLQTSHLVSQSHVHLSHLLFINNCLSAFFVAGFLA